MKKIIFFITACIVISSCSGGNSTNSGNNNENPNTEPALVPLTVNMLDLNNNSIPYIDMSKVGSYTVYKLKLTNPNSVSVMIPAISSDVNWENNQANILGITIEKYLLNYLPGTVTSLFVQTTNPDDCFVNESLSPGTSCAYYTYAGNLGSNYTSESLFSYPVSYNLEATYSSDTLHVTQCVKIFDAGQGISYNCANESKPGYAGQFVTYKMNPVNTGTTNLPLAIIGYGSAISQDGNFLYNCATSANQVNCDTYILTYNSVTNNIQTSSPTNIMSIAVGPGTEIRDIYPALNGSNAWVTLYNQSTGYSLVNTSAPDQVLSGNCSLGPCVPNINDIPSSLGSAGIIGLDGSMWWNTNLGADVYESQTGTFTITNIPPIIIGANSDGTAIAADSSGGACYRSGSTPSSYTMQTMLNYTVPSSGVRFLTANQYVYIEMKVTGLVNSNGVDYTQLNGFFKIHTESGLCEVRLDDYSLNPGEIDTPIPYVLSLSSFNQTSGYLSVSPPSNYYFGR